MLRTTDKDLARRLREVVAARGLSIKEVAEAVGVPYRTLQNQLLGHNRMPVTTYTVLLSFLDLPHEFLTEGRYRPKFRPIADALRQTLGPLLPNVTRDMGLLPPPEGERSEAELDDCARALAWHFIDAYERQVISLPERAIAEDWLAEIDAPEIETSPASGSQSPEK